MVVRYKPVLVEEEAQMMITLAKEDTFVKSEDYDSAARSAKQDIDFYLNEALDTANELHASQRKCEALRAQLEDLKEKLAACG